MAGGDSSGHFLFIIYLLLDEIGIFQRLVRTILCNSTNRLCRKVDGDVLVEFRHVDTLFLQVWSPLGLSTRVKLRRTSAVAVLTPDLGLLAGDFTFLCHKSAAIVPQRLNYATYFES